MTLPTGADVSIATGLPFDGPTPESKAKAARKFHDSLHESYALAAELQGSSLARAVFQQYQARLVVLASHDPVCATLEKIIVAWRNDLEVAPLLAEKEALRVLGPQIGAFAPFEREEAAPEDGDSG